MIETFKKTMFWTPRAAGSLFVLYMSLFALDIFDAQLGFWGTIVGSFMHLIRSILLAIAVFIAWKRERVGARLCIGWAIWYVSFRLGAVSWQHPGMAKVGSRLALGSVEVSMVAG